MPNDEQVAMLGRGATAWNAWRAERDEAPDLSRAALRGLDLSGFALSQAELRGADLRGTLFCDADLSGAHLEDAKLFKAVLLKRRHDRGKVILQIGPQSAEPDEGYDRGDRDLDGKPRLA